MTETDKCTETKCDYCTDGHCLDEDAVKETVKPKEMTVAEIEKELGYPVKVVKRAA